MSNAEQLMPEQNTISSCYVTTSSSTVQNRQQRSNPLYDVTKVVRDFWPSQLRKIEHMTESEMREHCKHMELPMARVKKVMRLDDDVRSQMISSDAPLLLAAASEMFIQELTLRAWQLVEEGRRKTLQKSDIAAAASRFEHFDFLIDIVPREDTKKIHDELMSNSLQRHIRRVVRNSCSCATMVKFFMQHPSDNQFLLGDSIIFSTTISPSFICFVICKRPNLELELNPYFIHAGVISQKNEMEIGEEKRAELKRKSSVGRWDYDIVASFSHHRVIEAEKLCFQEHQPIHGGRHGEKVYTVRSDVCENVIEIAREASNSDEGYDYAVAIVDRETGEVTFRPVRLCAFEATHSSDIPELIGIKKRAPVDYSASYDIKTDDWAKKRMDLTADFGSSKKLKFQEASIRRQVNNETLDAMRKTAFASTSVLTEPEDIKMEQITMVDKAQSSILPQAQPAALPRDIYPTSLFVNEEEMRELSECAVEHLSSTKKQLSESGFPEVVLRMLSTSASKNPSLAVPFTLLGCMTYISAMLSGKAIYKRQFFEVPFPEPFVQKVTRDFITAQFDRGVNGRAATRISVSTHEKDKLLAHLLALALTLSSECSLPITPWQIALKKSGRYIEKVLTGLGCVIVQCNVDEAARNESLRAARLLRPPSKESGTSKNPRRRTQ
ncbi:hypothetical protein KIN20_005478 [Parelaphostrongylus tenuis]|uniref:Transcription factor CBF/NF-Y/archaeal histone domain-containing protein n=1 Tax=Parelaphostrongylus tenuis TaxID=148309 RepID=A0AAD5QIL7_PARTN|nr:hypothetical protein KIN20_005478 [Parelaphostrongylus tenuis]